MGHELMVSRRDHVTVMVTVTVTVTVTVMVTVTVRDKDHLFWQQSDRKVDDQTLDDQT